MMAVSSVVVVVCVVLLVVLDILFSQEFTFDLSVEATVFVGRVVDSSLVTVRLNESVESLDFVAITAFLLALDVSGMIIMDFIGEFVVSWGMVFLFMVVVSLIGMSVR